MKKNIITLKKSPRKEAEVLVQERENVMMVSFYLRRKELENLLVWRQKDSHQFSFHCLGEINYDINDDIDNISGALVLGANADNGAFIYAKKLSLKTPEMNEFVLGTYPPAATSVPSRCYSGATLHDDEDKKECICGGSYSSEKPMLYKYDMLPSI